MCIFVFYANCCAATFIHKLVFDGVIFRQLKGCARLSASPFKIPGRLTSLVEGRANLFTTCRVFLPRCTPTSSLFSCMQFHPRYAFLEENVISTEIVRLTTTNATRYYYSAGNHQSSFTTLISVCFQCRMYIYIQYIFVLCYFHSYYTDSLIRIYLLIFSAC